MGIEYPVKITYTNDSTSLKKSQKEVQKGAKSSPQKESGGGIGFGGAAGAVALGGLLGDMLGSLDSISKLLEVIGGAINAFVAPFVPILLTLLKPFLALFLAVGAMLAKFLKFMLAGGTGTAGEGATVTNEDGAVEAGDSFLKSVAILAAGLAAVAAVIAGAPVWLVAAIAIAAGFLAKTLWEPISNAIFKASQFLDNLFGTDLTGSIQMIFQGFTDVVLGLVDILWSLVTLDWDGIVEGFKRLFLGLWELLKGVFMFTMEVLKVTLLAIWELLKAAFILGFEVVKTIGTWIWDTLTGVFETAFETLSNIGSWISDKVKSFFSFGKGSSRSVNDAVITPTGQVIETNPRDYLIATKNPSMLGGGSSNITVNINGSADRSTVDEIVRRIQQELRARGNY